MLWTGAPRHVLTFQAFPSQGYQTWPHRLTTPHNKAGRFFYIVSHKPRKKTSRYFQLAVFWRKSAPVWPVPSWRSPFICSTILKRVCITSCGCLGNEHNKDLLTSNLYLSDGRRHGTDLNMLYNVLIRVTRAKEKTESGWVGKEDKRENSKNVCVYFQ